MNTKNAYIAHLINDTCEQTLIEHLNSVALLCEAFSCDLTKDLALLAGQVHDIGKYSEAFQQRIRGSSIQVEHALGGALYVKNVCRDSASALMLQYAIIGHHSGLPDGGSAADLAETATLQGRLKRNAEDFSAYKAEITPVEIVSSKISALLLTLAKEGKKTDLVEVFAFFTRYIFSCLTDADFLDTERFYNPKVDRGYAVDFSYALGLLDQKINRFIPDTPVKKARAELLSQVCRNAEDAEQINIVNMPTGSGKTLTSLKAALQIAKREGKKRIIYVIPYTSIIEQTAQEFTKIFKNSVTVLQHHSNFDYNVRGSDVRDETSTADKLKKASENWDCPVVITTNVQFFESLYHYRSSKLRKMHNLSDAVIIFDEVHMLPIEFLQPCLRAVGYVTEFLNSKAIFLSATMPDFGDLFHRYIPNCKIKNLITDTSCYANFRNTQIQYIGEQSLEGVAMRVSENKSSLIVTGTKKSARALFKMIGGEKYHLSTYMTPEHRSKVIAAVKEDLANNEIITVVSTSLIEAGVDLDFEVVFREAAGIENILQSAGRCNREGKRKTGDVYVYLTEEKQKGEMEIKRNITLDLMKKYPDIADERCIKEYFSRLYGFNFTYIERNSIAGDGASPVPLTAIPFREYSEKFTLIVDDTVAIIVNRSEECAKLLRGLQFGNLSVKRSLQKYSVSVRFYEFQDALKQGLVHEVNGVYVLSDNNYYSDDYGLSIKECHDERNIYS